MAAIGLISSNHHRAIGCASRSYLLSGLRTHLCISGCMSFRYPTIKGNVTTIKTAKNLTGNIIAENIQPFLVNLEAAYATYGYTSNSVDASLWHNRTACLLVMNMNKTEVIMPWSAGG